MPLCHQRPYVSDELNTARNATGSSDDGRRPVPHYRPPRRTKAQSRARARYRLATVGVMLVLISVIAGAAIAFARLAPVSVTIDGARARVPAGTTLGQAQVLGVVHVPYGAMRDVEGSILPTVAGPAGIVTVNGRPAAASTQLRWGDELSYVRGADATETVLEREIPVRYKTVKRGSGSHKHVARKGKKGVKLERFGEFSGKVASSEVLVKPVSRIVEYSDKESDEPAEKVVALTFDDGPWDDQTLEILDILDRYEIKAAFFMVGTRVAVDPSTAAEIARRGHTLGNHSYSHPDLTTKADSEVRSQIRRTNAAISKAAGRAPRWFRAPGGALDADVRAVVADEGLRIAHWTLGTGDWKNLGSDRIVRVVNKQIRPGAVILMHDGGGTRKQTIEALPRVIENLQAQGYRFVPLDALPSVPTGGASY